MRRRLCPTAEEDDRNFRPLASAPAKSRASGLRGVFRPFFPIFFSEPVYCVEAFEHPSLFLSTVVGVNFQSVFLTGISGSVITAAILCQQFSHSPLVRPNPCQISTLSTFSTPAPRSEGIYHTVPGTSRITFFFRKGPQYGTNIHVTSLASLSSIVFRPSIGIRKNFFVVNHAALALEACTCSVQSTGNPILCRNEFGPFRFGAVPSTDAALSPEWF